MVDVITLSLIVGLIGLEWSGQHRLGHRIDELHERIDYLFEVLYNAKT